MNVLFSPIRPTLAVAALVLLSATPSFAANFKQCHGYVRHASDVNVRVHCIDGTPADLSFVTVPKFVGTKGGKTMQVNALRPGTPVHVIYTQTVGIRHAYKIFVADPNGRGLYGFKS